MLSMKRVDQRYLLVFLLSTFFFICRSTNVTGNATSQAAKSIKPSPNITAITTKTLSAAVIASNSSAAFTTIVSNLSISTNTSTTINATAAFTSIPIRTSAVEPTKHATTAKPTQDKGTSRRFDGLSFFGGIILGAAICVILLFAMKYYQAKKRSYHSL